ARRFAAVAHAGACPTPRDRRGGSPSESRLSPQSSVSPMIAVGNGHLLLYGNTLVASVRRQGTSSRSLNCRAAEDQRPFLPQAHLAPLRRGLFLRSWPPGGATLISGAPLTNPPPLRV